MPKKRKCINRKENTRVRYRFIASAIAIAITMMPFYDDGQVRASGCPDLKIIFARGSGGERYTNDDYIAFKAALEDKLATTNLTYDFDDLDYPAISIDIMSGHLGTLLNAYIGGGEAYDFGDSMHEGVDRLLEIINNDVCRDTKYVLGGYSQGALVILNGLEKIDPNRVIYAATFGDPKIYLPEGAGPVPLACGGKNLSEYRIYVPDCRAYKGIMGARDPYTTSGYERKIGTWCNKFDVLCSSYIGIKSHTSYVEDGLYEDASRLIMSKIGAWYGIKNQYTSPHDTAILIDSTGSMESLIDQYKDEAMHLAQETLEAGGRVALYDYRDLNEGYTPVERCNFDTCDLTTFQSGLDDIEVGGGGDAPESLLSASLHVMKQLRWNFGSTKSLVILTDSDYHSPDLDGTTFYDVIKLSKQIDPVNFYVITTPDNVPYYDFLTRHTDGAVVSLVNDLSLLTESIAERYDSLPKVEEEFYDEVYDNELPVIKIKNIEDDGDSVKINFENSGETTAVILNDGILGETKEQEITITDLKRDIHNTITIVPLSATKRGEGVSINLEPTNSVNTTDNDHDTATIIDNDHSTATATDNDLANDQETSGTADSDEGQSTSSTNADTEQPSESEENMEDEYTQTTNQGFGQSSSKKVSILSRIPDMPTYLVPKAPNTGQQ